MSHPREPEFEVILSVPPTEPRDPEEIRRLDNLSLDYIKQSLSQTDLDDVPSGCLRKLYLWIESWACDKRGDVSDSNVLDEKVPNEYSKEQKYI